MTRDTLPEPAATMYRLTEALRNDLAFAAPEVWPLHIERRLAEAYEAALRASADAAPGPLLPMDSPERHDPTSSYGATIGRPASTPITAHPGVRAMQARASAEAAPGPLDVDAMRSALREVYDRALGPWLVSLSVETQRVIRLAAAPEDAQ